MAKKLALKSFRLKNFKAIRDSGVVKFTPLTVLIGDNGSGKSSLVEGLQTYQRIVTDGLDEAMQMWRGFENIQNAAVSHDITKCDKAREYQANPIEFGLSHSLSKHDKPNRNSAHTHFLSVACGPDGDEIFILEERWNVSGRKYMTRDADGYLYYPNGERLGGGISYPISYPLVYESEALWSGTSLINSSRAHIGALYSISSWQFLTLNVRSMGEPQPIQRTGGMIRLRSDGSNIAEFLKDIVERDRDAFDGILEALQFVLPYMRELQPKLTAVLGHQAHLEMTEEDFKVMGWLLSTGTLRILALLALFRHPDPPPLIVIEEIENGLDPRTIHLIVDEIQDVVESGRSQVIVTTHSTYLLDLLPLSTILMVERVEGQPTFSRPADDDSLKNWAKTFAPGKLYTMGNLNRQKTV